MIDLPALSAFAQVVLVDLTLAGDNAIVVGIAAGVLTGPDRRRVIIIGTVVATVLRVLLALVATQLLAIIGLTLAGGILLLWVAWRLFREFSRQKSAAAARQPGEAQPSQPSDLPRQVLLRIVLADISMSLDNVLAVAGTARNHFWVLVFGLALSVALMAVASTLVAKMMERRPWIAWVGVGIVAYVAGSMILDGWQEVRAAIG